MLCLTLFPRGNKKVPSASLPMKVQRCARFYCPDEHFRRFSLLPVRL